LIPEVYLAGPTPIEKKPKKIDLLVQTRREKNKIFFKCVRKFGKILSPFSPREEIHPLAKAPQIFQGSKEGIKIKIGGKHG
jgi:hypothetical protein